MKKLIIISISLFFILAGCGKKYVTEDYLDGDWKADNNTDGHIEFKGNKMSTNGEYQTEYHLTYYGNDTDFVINAKNPEGHGATNRYEATKIDKNRIKINKAVLVDKYDNTIDEVDVDTEYYREGGGFFGGLWTLIKSVGVLLFLAFAGYAIYYTLKEKKQNKES